MGKFIFALMFFATAGFASDHSVTIAGKKYRTGLIPRPADMPGEFTAIKVRGDLPEAYDSRDLGLVTTIKNQGNCGSCWSFARTKAFEAATILAGRATGEELNLAEQDALVNDRNSYGCRGGFMDGRFEVSKGITTEELCPYRASSRYGCNGAKFAKALRWSMIGEEKRAPSVDELRQAIVDYGVIAVTVAAGGSFSPNAEGRITSCGSRGINHMVTLAGYRPAPSGGYEFLIANSWGEKWGDGGFAWSKQGCNQLASVAGDAALYFYLGTED
jgi:C1A family cysteine protease